MTAFRMLYLASLLVGVGYLLAGWEQPLGTVERPGDGPLPSDRGGHFHHPQPGRRGSKSAPGGRPGPGGRGLPPGRGFTPRILDHRSLVLFAALFRLLGFHLCTLALMVAVLRILSPWKWRKIILVSLALTLLSYFFSKSCWECHCPGFSLGLEAALWIRCTV